MDFELTDEQTLLKESVGRFMRAHYSIAQRDRNLAEADGFSRDAYGSIAELGITGLLVSEEHGGSGRNAEDLMLVMEEFGRGLFIEPFVPSNVMAVDLIRRLGSESQQANLLPALAAGERIVVPALFEPGARYEAGRVSARAARNGHGWRLDGAKSMVAFGDVADVLLVSAMTAEGPALFAIPRSTRGISCAPYRLQDGQASADISFANVDLRPDALVGKAGAAADAIARALQLGIAAICAEAVGAMSAMLELTIGYLQTRKQFGVQIGTFQALQHRIADMAVAVEQARSMAIYAAMMAEHPDETERARAISAAKIQICRSCRFVGQQAIQLHGGMGVTLDLDVGRYFVRTTMIQLQFGDMAHHLKLVADAGGLFEAAPREAVL